MKYTIESTKEGCIETLEFSDGSTFVRRSERVPGGIESFDNDFKFQLKRAGFCEEIADKVCDTFDGFLASDFLDIAKFEQI